MATIAEVRPRVCTNVLDEIREITRTYPDGSFDCPFCLAAVIAPAARCSNPWCSACDYAMSDPERTRPAFAERRRKEEAERLRQQEEKARRESVARAAEERHQAHEQWERDTYAEARRRGACLRCVIAPGWERAKFVKHRGACPRTK